MAAIEAIRAIERDPEERKKWLTNSRFLMIYGKKEKVLRKDEEAFRPIFRKSLMAGVDIPKGTVIIPELLYAMRPQQYAGGLPSERYGEVLGKQTIRALKKYEPITSEIIG